MSFGTVVNMISENQVSQLCNHCNNDHIPEFASVVIPSVKKASFDRYIEQC